jgi:hypothetical protein
MTDKSEWEQVEVGYKLCPPMLNTSAGRPRTRRFKGFEEGGTGKKKMHRCRRCDQFGHQQRTCNEPVYDSDAPPPAPPKPKRVGNKKKEVVTAEPSGQLLMLEAPPPPSPSFNSPGALTRG